MKVIVGGRRIGKTRRLIDWFCDDALITPENTVESNSILIAATTHEALRLQRIIAGLLRVEPKELERYIIAATSLPNALRGKTNKHTRIAVDEAQWVLGQFLGQVPDIASMTVEQTIIPELDKTL